MKRLLVLALFAYSCQPDYGHLQPEYEQLLEVKDTLQVRKEEVRRNRAAADSLQHEIEELNRLIDEYEKDLNTNIRAYKRIVDMETRWNSTATKVVEREINENKRLRAQQRNR
jgi:chromosome segregation ATPase